MSERTVPGGGLEGGGGEVLTVDTGEKFRCLKTGTVTIRVEFAIRMSVALFSLYCTLIYKFNFLSTSLGQFYQLTNNSRSPIRSPECRFRDQLLTVNHLSEVVGRLDTKLNVRLLRI